METVREKLLYDPDTGKFHRRKGNIEIGFCKGGYVWLLILGRKYPAHKIAWFHIHGEWALVDHKDRNGLNNKLINLRSSNYQLNAANRCLQPNNTGIKGVYERDGFFEVGIKVNQKRIYLGRYKDREQAAEAYKQAAIQYFGEFANYKN